MAESLLQILQQLKAKQLELQAEIEALRQRIRELQEDNEELQTKTADALRAREEALMETEYLKVSYRLAESPDSLVETRRIIAGLIKNIDRCITMLKE